MAVEQREVIECEVRIDASPETVFEFFVDPEKMTRWKGRRAELDPQPGGMYRVEISDQAVARGEYVAIEPARAGRLHLGLGRSGIGAARGRARVQPC